MQAGEHKGYIITCRRHHDDSDDRTSPECKKSLYFGADDLSAAECIRRLKNWFILGNDSATPTLRSYTWPAGRYRSAHVFRYGGRRLCDLASDNADLITYNATDEVLDIMCEDVGKDEWQAEADGHT